MESDLASKLYEASQSDSDTGIQVDELGIPFKVNHDARYHCSYLTARCFIRNPHLHVRPDGNVYNSHTLIQPTLDDIAQLADWVERLPRQQVLNVYKQIKDHAPQLDPDVIAITPTLAWRFSTQSFETPPKGEEEFNVISDW